MNIEILARTFEVLEALSQGGAPLPLSEIAQRTKLPKPTAHRLLQALLELGYVAQEGPGGFYPTTSKLAQLGEKSSNLDLRRRALPHMQRLHTEFNETVNLGVLENLSVHYVHYIETTRPLRRMVMPGAIDEYYSTALGRAIVAHLPRAERAALVARTHFRALTPHTLKNKSQIEDMLKQTRSRGWALDDEESDAGVICFAVPLFDGERPIGAISISLPRTRLTPEGRNQIIAALGSIPKLGEGHTTGLHQASHAPATKHIQSNLRPRRQRQQRVINGLPRSIRP